MINLIFQKKNFIFRFYLEKLWIDPYDYKQLMSEAVKILNKYNDDFICLQLIILLKKDVRKILFI